jgi:hypothetical protein
MRRWLLTPLVASLFVLSFVESWAALLAAARAAGIPYPKPWPWMVDGFIVATALLVVEARRAGHGAGVWWPRLGLLGATALSTGIQAAWAPRDDWAWALHAWSPLAVLFSFECLVWLAFTARPAWEPTPLGHPVPEPAPEPEPAPDPEPRPRARANGAAFSAAQLNQIRGWVTEERPVRWMARELGLDDNTRTRKLAPLVRSLKGDLVRPGGGS